jgi:thiamine biosynthesis lipoprotein
MGAGGIVMALSLAWNAAGAELLRVEKSAEAMGSTFGVIVYGTDRARLDAAADAALGEAQRLDRMLSNYLADSEWSEVNRDAGIRPVRLSAELFQLISDCMKYSRQSGGAFDIAVGPLMKAWGFYRGEGGLPKADEVRNALARTGYRHVLLDPAAHTIRFDRPGVELDPGGIGKGYAVDRMVEVLKESGVEIALVSAAGSSIYGLGAPPDEPQGWRHPFPERREATSGCVSEERITFNIRQLREVLLGGRSAVLPHHGSAQRLSSEGGCVGFGARAADDRQRGMGQALFHQWTGLDGRTQAQGLSRILLRRY